MPAETNTPAALGGANPSPDEPESNRAMKDLAMAHTSRPPRPSRHSRESVAKAGTQTLPLA
jgi:hypothetical protein